jgi:hypothetical protein
MERRGPHVYHGVLSVMPWVPHWSTTMRHYENYVGFVRLRLDHNRLLELDDIVSGLGEAGGP